MSNLYRVALHFKSGNKIEVKCSGYSFKVKDSNLEFCGYQLDECVPHVSFQPSQLEAYEVTKES